MEAIEFSAITNSDMPKFQLYREANNWAYKRNPDQVSQYFREALSIIEAKFVLNVTHFDVDC